MATLFVNSIESYAGKTAISIGLASLLRKSGLSVGYMKPIGNPTVTVGNQLADEDAVFVKKMLDLDDPIQDICPIILTQEMREQALREGLDKSEQLVAAHQRASKGRDVLIMEGIGNLSTGHIIGLPAPRIAELTNAAVVTVIQYKRELSAEDILLAKSIFGERLAGVIINQTPESERALKRNRLASAFLPREKVPLLGILPIDPLLHAITIGELTELLGGRILCRPEKQNELVETFSIGAMTADSALRYFLRSANKAVITGGDRSEVQLAALQTSVKCIILTGNLYPAAVVLARADELGVPMILVPWDTRTTVDKVEQALGRVRMSSPEQVQRAQNMIENEVDVNLLRSVLKV